MKWACLPLMRPKLRILIFQYTLNIIKFLNTVIANGRNGQL